MINYPSKTLNAPSVTSRLASTIEYFPTSDLVVAGGKVPVGAENPSSMAFGSYYGTVQQAIDDLVGIAVVPIGGAVISWENVSPAGAAQAQRILFTGNIVNPNSSSLGVTINILGIPFVFPNNTTAQDIQRQVFEKFDGFARAGKYFERVVNNTDGTIDVIFLDRVYHAPVSINKYGLTLTGTITSPHAPGYGDWLLVTQEEKSAGNTLYYFKRIA